MMEGVPSVSLPDIIKKAKEIRKKQNQAGCGGTVLPGEYILQKCPDFQNTISTVCSSVSQAKPITGILIRSG